MTLVHTSIKEHLKDRYFNSDLHKVWIDEEDRVATFPLWNLCGQFVGYHSYRPDSGKKKKNDEKGRYYTFRGDKLIPKHTPSTALWGLESWFLSNTLFVTEGVFDASRLTYNGVSAVAVISNDPNRSTQNLLRCIRANRPVVSICDPGKAGAKLKKVGHVSHVVDIPGMDDADLGDAPDWYVQQLIEEYKGM